LRKVVSKSKLSIEELLDAGVPLEELLTNSKPVEVNVTVDTDKLSATMQKTLVDNINTAKTIQTTVTKSNEFNKDLLLKALGVLMKQNKDKQEVTGIKVIRDQYNLISELEFIR